MINVEHDANTALVARCKQAARLCAWVVVALGFSVLLGWALDITALKTVLPGLVSMKPNTALGFVLAGASLLSSFTAQAGGQRSQRLLATAVMLLGLFTLGEYAFAIDFGIDQLLFSVPSEAGQLIPPGRMSAATAAAFAVTGLALLTLDRRQGAFLAQIAAFVGSLIGLFALLGYVYGVAALYNFFAYSSVALHTAVAVMLINLGVLLARPQDGVMAVVTSQTLGGVMARRLLPVALVTPFLIGWLRLQGEQRGLFANELGIALVALTYVVLFSVLIWRTAAELRRMEQRRSRAELAQADKTAQLDALIDSAMDAIIMLDSAQHIVLFNRAAETMFDRTAADMLGEALDVLLPHSIRETHVQQVAAFGASGTSKRSMGGLGTVTGVRANGEAFPIESTISRVTLKNSPHYVIILRDITEQQQARQTLQKNEAELRAFFENPAVGSVEVSLDGRFLRMNERFCRITGYSAEELRAMPSAALIHPEDQAREAAALATYLSGKSSNFHIEKRYIRKDGEVIWVEVTAALLRDTRGQPLRSVGIVQDITQRKLTETALLDARAQAERANNAKSRFLAAASHDLRQPLTAINIYAGSLKNHVMPNGLRMLANMNNCIGSLTVLLNDLLDFSKLEAGVVIPNRSEFGLAGLLANLNSDHAPEAQAKGLQLHMRPTLLTAHTDPVLLKRVLGNLIANAVRYTERGGVLVACRRRQGKTWVEVWDTGIGIPPNKRGEIFEEFRQLDNEARNGGSGLGLTIVERTAALLGLQIRVSSRPGRGSMFAIEVPTRQVALVLPDLAPHPSVFQPLVIALVEDNPDVREALTEVLQMFGHRVTATATGAEMLAKLGSFVPDIVISDYRLPRGEMGLDVIKAVRAAVNATLPALLITGDTDPKLIRTMAERNIVVLHKPLELDLLQTYLEQLAPPPPEDVQCPGTGRWAPP